MDGHFYINVSSIVSFVKLVVSVSWGVITELGISLGR